jgi:ribosomal protein S18
MFKKYNSIENSYRKEFLERLERNGFDEVLSTLEKKDFKLIKKFISSNAAILVRNSFRK